MMFIYILAGSYFPIFYYFLILSLVLHFAYFSSVFKIPNIFVTVKIHVLVSYIFFFTRKRQKLLFRAVLCHSVKSELFSSCPSVHCILRALLYLSCKAESAVVALHILFPLTNFNSSSFFLLHHML